MLIASRPAGGTASATGSLVASPPGAITTSPIRSGPLPYALVSRILTLTPPALVSTISRIVALRKPARDRFPGVAACGLAAHVAIQWLPAGTGTGLAAAGASESITAPPIRNSTSKATGAQRYRRTLGK